MLYRCLNNTKAATWHRLLGSWPPRQIGRDSMPLIRMVKGSILPFDLCDRLPKKMLDSWDMEMRSESVSKSDINHAWSYFRLQVRFSGAWRCMLVWRVNLDLSCLGWMIYARQFLGAKPRTQFHHRWAETSHSNHYTDSEQASRLSNLLVPSAKLRKANFPVFTSLVWCGRGTNPSLLHPATNHYAMGPAPTAGDW